MRVLVVDDYPGAAEAAQQLVELLGHECRTALCGRDALEVVASFDPDVVLLDIGLPDVSGYDVARALRSRETTRRAFIVALTGWATAEDRAKSIAAGIDVHLRKPPQADAIAEVLARASRVRETDRAGRP